MRKVLDLEMERKKMSEKSTKQFDVQVNNNFVAWLDEKAKKSYQTNFTPRDAAALATEILDKARKEFGYNDESATPIVKIVNAFGIAAYTANNLSDDISGTIYANGTTKECYQNNVVIFTNMNEPYRHQRFVLAHELGHYIFDCRFNPQYKDQRKVFKKNYPHNEHSSIMENRANRFAAELLMPKKLFVEQYNQYVNRIKKYNLDSIHSKEAVICYLADFFDVKIESIERRIQEVLYDGGY